MSKKNPKYECTHPNCSCDDKDDCLAEKKNRHQAQVNMKKSLNGENDGF